MELGVATLGIAIAKVVLRLGGDSDVADSITDLVGQNGRNPKDQARENVEEALGAVIAQRLTERLPPGMKLDSTDFLAAAEDVKDLMFRLLTDEDATLAAVRDGANFKRWVLANGARGLRRKTSARAEPIFDAVLEAACDEFVRFAPSSSLLLSAGIRAVLDKIEHIPDLADHVARIPQMSADLTLAALDDRDARLRTSLPNWVVNASISATRAGRLVGRPVSEWTAAELGVHDSIDTPVPSSGLTDYILRSHDDRLRQLVEDVVERKGQSLFLLAVGTSCAGKTRAIYECVKATLPEWQLVAPGTAQDLRNALAAGIPAKTVIWWDELQLRISRSEAIGVAPALQQLLQAHDDGAGPVVVASTVWRANLLAMESRSVPEDAAKGADSLPQLLELATKVPIVDHFSEPERDRALRSSDARVRIAAETSSFRSEGWQVTQTLAGGSTLLSRMTQSEVSAGAGFSPSARAMLLAASDLRRVGLENPLPAWAVEGSAVGYLGDPRPVETWLPDAIDECTRDASNDDAVTGRQSLDFRRTGVPALRVQWIGGATSATKCYELHEILLHERLNSVSPAPLAPSLWECLSSRLELLPNEERQRISEFARTRAMFTLAHAFQTDPLERLGILVELGDEGALLELSTLAKRDLDKYGSWGATRELVRALSNSRDLSPVDGRLLADSRLEAVLGIRYTDLMFETAATNEFARRHLEQLSSRSLYVAARLASLRPGWDRARGWRAELAEEAARGNWYAKAELRDERAIEGDEAALQDLRERSDLNSLDARRRLRKVLARRSVKDNSSGSEIREWAIAGDAAAQEELVSALSADPRALRSQAKLVDELRDAVLLGWPRAARVLLAHFRSINPNVRELDPDALPL
jgi:hypothetical protein